MQTTSRTRALKHCPAGRVRRSCSRCPPRGSRGDLPRWSGGAKAAGPPREVLAAAPPCRCPPLALFLFQQKRGRQLHQFGQERDEGGIKFSFVQHALRPSKTNLFFIEPQNLLQCTSLVKIVRNAFLPFRLSESRTKPNPQARGEAGERGGAGRTWKRPRENSPFRPHSPHRAANTEDSVSMFLMLAS